MQCIKVLQKFLANFGYKIKMRNDAKNVLFVIKINLIEFV